MKRTETSDRVHLDVELGGKAYRLIIKPWPYKIGRRWLTRLVKILGGLAARFHEGGGSMSEGQAIEQLLEKMPDELLEELLDTCEEQTDAVPLEGERRGKAIPFGELTPLLARRYDLTLRIAAEHLRLSFGPFFGSLSSVLADLSGPLTTASNDGGDAGI